MPVIMALALRVSSKSSADRKVVLDDQWIPPCLACSAAAPLTGLLAELAGLLNQRGEALAARLTAPGSRGVADVSDFLLLQSVNRSQKLMAHWSSDANIHPGGSLFCADPDGR